ncbi:MAG: hypothetical protein IJ542_03345 [Clostridia bacterium]|nr:hypothetical protein [Clostridia bacterium]
MKIEFVTLVLLLTILLMVLLIFPMHAKLKVHINVLTLVCEYSLKVLNIKLLCGRVSIKEGEFVILNSHNKLFSGTKERQKKQGLLIKNLLSRLTISRIEVYFELGLKNYAAMAIACGFFQSLFSSLLAMTITNNPCVHIIESVSPNFSGEQCELTSQALLELSLLDIVRAKIKANKLHRENINGK